MSIISGEPAGEKERPSPTLLSAVTRALEEAIVSGEFPPGSALREVSLAGRFKASRGTVREALRALSEQGLVEIHSRRGAVVPQLSPQSARDFQLTRRARILCCKARPDRRAYS